MRVKVVHFIVIGQMSQVLVFLVQSGIEWVLPFLFVSHNENDSILALVVFIKIMVLLLLLLFLHSVILVDI